MNNKPNSYRSWIGLFLQKKFRVFCLLWALTFALYAPTLKAGWVIDAAGWLYHVRHDSFYDYINNTFSQVRSLYQLTELTTYIFYKLWGANVYAWGLLYISLHALNALLLFLVCGNLFYDSGIKKGREVALAGAILFYSLPAHI